MVIFVWVFILFGLHRAAPSGYIEIVRSSGDENFKFHLNCRHLNSIIAVLEANFTAVEVNETERNISDIIAPNPFPASHPRQALNHRCSGVNYCSFILTEDCPGADTWGRGTLSIEYACISDNRIKRFCNSEIILPYGTNNDTNASSEGFIHNPGYPRFYSSERQCRWIIIAPQQQRIRLTILDIAVMVDNPKFPDDCTDRIDVKDSGQIIHSTCRQQEPPLQITSATDTMEIVLSSTHSLIPLRGVLLHYTAVGCPTPLAPEDGYLVYRNDSTAEYRCCVGFVFADTGERTKFINCLGSYWDVTLPLPLCQRKAIQPTVQESNKIIQKSDMASDLIAPALLIVALFLINFIVLFYIYKIKQKHALEYVDQELGSLPVTSKSTTS